MAGSHNAFSGGKRAKERLRAEKKAEKEERKKKRQSEKAQTGSADGVDPDIAHIVPGPQPVVTDDENEDGASDEADEAEEERRD